MHGSPLVTRIALALVAIALVGCNGSPGNPAGRDPAAPDGGATKTTGSPTAPPAADGTTDTGTPAPPSTDVTANDAGDAPPAPEVTTPTGLRYVDLAVGEGAAPKRGQEVTIRYSEWIDGGRKIEADKTLSFAVGTGRVIRGLDEGVATMKVGGRRRMTLPPNLGYGQNARTDKDIPPNSTLTLEVELTGIR